MSMTELTQEDLLARYQLLCKACQPDGRLDAQLNRELDTLTAFIQQDLPALTQKGCPDNITTILHALTEELTRFRSFCEFPELATKSIVGFGGGFSTGKSSLINTLIGQKRMVAEIDPTTAMPAYVLQGDDDRIMALNSHHRAIELSLDEFQSLTHEEQEKYGSQVGRLLTSAFVSVKDFQWPHLAFLDTPGYSKPEDQHWNARTDENVAHLQLNASDCIVWVVSAEAGVISERDIQFLSSLEQNIPKLVVISRADKRSVDDIDEIVKLTRSTLANCGLNIVDVLPFSTRKRSGFTAEAIKAYLAEWNKQQNTFQFVQSFKRQFLAYQHFLEQKKRLANRRLDKINRILTLSDDDTLLDDATDLQKIVKKELTTLTELVDQLALLSQQFFTQLKRVGDSVVVPLPRTQCLRTT